VIVVRNFGWGDTHPGTKTRLDKRQDRRPLFPVRLDFLYSINPDCTSIGFTTGLLGRKIAANTIVKTVINAGLEAAVRQLARELAPLRVYGVSPGPVDTPNWGALSDDARRERAAKLAATLPVGFMASADETAQAYLFAMQARALTGTVIDLDSGAMVGA